MNTAREIMERLIDYVRDKEPVGSYRLKPGLGWFDLERDFPVKDVYAGVVLADTLEYVEPYISVKESGRVVYRLVREPSQHWYYLHRMEIDDDDTVISRYYELFPNDLVTLLLECCVLEPRGE